MQCSILTSLLSTSQWCCFHNTRRLSVKYVAANNWLVARLRSPSAPETHSGGLPDSTVCGFFKNFKNGNDEMIHPVCYLVISEAFSRINRAAMNVLPDPVCK